MRKIHEDQVVHLFRPFCTLISTLLPCIFLRTSLVFWLLRSMCCLVFLSWTFLSTFHRFWFHLSACDPLQNLYISFFFHLHYFQQFLIASYFKCILYFSSSLYQWFMFLTSTRQRFSKVFSNFSWHFKRHRQFVKSIKTHHLHIWSHMGETFIFSVCSKIN